MHLSYKLTAEETKDLWRLITYSISNAEWTENNKPISKDGLSDEDVKKAKKLIENDYSKNDYEDFDSINSTILLLTKEKKIGDLKVDSKSLKEHFHKDFIEKQKTGFLKDKVRVFLKLIFDTNEIKAKDGSDLVLEIKDKLDANTELRNFLFSQNEKSPFITGIRKNVENGEVNPLKKYTGTYISVKPSRREENKNEDALVWIYYWKFYIENGKGKIRRPTYKNEANYYDGDFKLQQNDAILSIVMNLITNPSSSMSPSFHHYLTKINHLNGIVQDEFMCVSTGISNGNPITENEFLIKISPDPEYYEEIKLKYRHEKFKDFINPNSLVSDFGKKASNEQFVEALRKFLKPQKEIAIRLCHAKYIHLEIDPSYQRFFKKRGFEEEEEYEPLVRTEYIYTKVIKYAKVNNTEHTSMDEAYSKNAYVDMQLLYPTENAIPPPRYSPIHHTSEMIVPVPEFSSDIVVTSASYINDFKTNPQNKNPDEDLKNIYEEIKTGIKFSRETEAGILTVDFTSLKNFNDVNIRLKQITYKRGGNEIKTNNEITNFKFFDLKEPIENEILIEPNSNHSEDVEGFFRIEVKTDIKKNDHVIITFFCEPKRN